MKRWLAGFFALLVAALGALFSGINSSITVVDLYFANFQLPIGVMLLITLLLGCLMAGVILYMGVILPLRLRLRGLSRDAAKAKVELVNTANN